MALLSKLDIWEAADSKTEEVKVPEWGGEVLIKTLSAAERDDFESSVAGTDGKKPNLRNFRAKYVAKCTVDAHGNHLFTENDLEKLGRKSAKAVDRIYSAAQKLNAMSNEDVAELVEDFDATPDGHSTSA